MRLAVFGPASSNKVLVTCTLRSDLPARLALAFANAGADVEAICFGEQALHHTGAVRKVYRYNPARPIAGLRKAIMASNPALILPTDERGVAHLHRLYDELATAPDLVWFRDLIRRSLGDPEHYPVLRSRHRFLEIALQEGLTIPDTSLVSSPADLEGLQSRLPFPWVLKKDGSWGGNGVLIAANFAEAEQAYLHLTRRVDLPGLVREMIVSKDYFDAFSMASGSRKHVIVQSFASGAPANCAIACWQGSVLACVSAVALETEGSVGPAVSVRLIDHPEMAQGAIRIARRLNLSGNFGLDFILNEATGDTTLLEINARATRLSCLPLGPGRDCAEALVSRVAGRQPRARPSVTDKLSIAYFPQAWKYALLTDDFLQSVYHDVPWSDPNLVRYGIRPLRRDRSILAKVAYRMLNALHRNPSRMAQQPDKRKVL